MEIPPEQQIPEVQADEVAMAAVAAAAGISLVGGGPPPFTEDPQTYFGVIASQHPSREGLSKLAGRVALWVQHKPSQPAAQGEDGLSAARRQVPFLYLQAAARQLAGDAQAQRVGDVEQEMARTQQQYEILEAVGHAARHCQPRQAISQSGIIGSLAHMSVMATPSSSLHNVTVEFLQCCLLAEQYRYAERMVLDTWPRPGQTVSVRQVLRYYYLRGLIHVGCNNWKMAQRCFWTCLTVPADVCSKIAICAWKKLILVQCLAGAKSTSLPKSMPNCLYRRLVTYFKDPPAVSSDLSSPTSLTAKAAAANAAALTFHHALVAYTEFTKAFFASDRAALERIETENASTFQEDGNTGLIRQCNTKLLHNQVEHLASIYSVVSTSKLASSLAQSDDKIIAILLQSGVPCEIQDDGMVSFPEQVEKPDIDAVDIGEWIHLMDKIQKLDASIATSKKYLALVRKESGSEKASSAAATGPRGVEDL